MNCDFIAAGGIHDIFRSYYFFFSNPMAGFYSTSYLWYCAIGWFVTMLIGTVTSLLLGERQIKQV